MPVGERKPLRVACVIAAGDGSRDHGRVQELMAALGASAEYLFVDRGRSKVSSLARLTRALRQTEADLVFLEGTGLAAGLAVMAAETRGRGLGYIVSSGDAVTGYFRNRYGPAMGLLMGIYERALYRRSFAFAGWTPYLTGRAIRMGAPRGLTIEGFVPEGLAAGDAVGMRRRLGIDPDHLVVGVSGSINWSPRQQYAYGLELVEASRHVTRRDVRFLVVGDGTGLPELKNRASGDRRFVFTGRVAHEQMGAHIACMDAAVIAQTPDELGMLRLTTKLPEYLAIGVPVVITAIPGALDYLCDSSGHDAVGSLLPLAHPASGRVAAALGSWIEAAERPSLVAASEHCRDIARRRFSVDDLAARLGALLDVERPDRGAPE